MSRQDSILSGGESDSERKPESTPSQNKQPPTSKRATSRGEVGIINFAMNLHKNQNLVASVLLL